jgi:hypothetical protein
MGLVFYSWTFFWLVTGYSQVWFRHQLADCSDHIFLVQDTARRGGLAEDDPARKGGLAEEDPARRGGLAEEDPC